MAEMTKGMLVHRRGYNGDVDRRYKYKIRSIGKKRAILDYVPNEDESRYGRSRGTAYDLATQEQLERYEGRDLPSYIKRTWIEHFVPCNDGDWDLEENY